MLLATSIGIRLFQKHIVQSQVALELDLYLLMTLVHQLRRIGELSVSEKYIAQTTLLAQNNQIRLYCR